MKGIGELIEAYQKCKITNKKLLLIGGSSFGDSKETSFIKEIKDIINKDESIILTGFVDHNEVPKYLSAADIYISPSKYYEAAPLANIEAMCLGLPCVVSDRGGITEYINKSCKVINIDKDASNTILEAINELYDNFDSLSENNVEKSWGKDIFFNRFSRLMI